MKVSKKWLKELIEINSWDQVLDALTKKTISTKEITEKFIELDMKGYNRADLLSIRGVATEVAAITGKVALFNNIKSHILAEVREAEFEVRKDLAKVEVEIEDVEDCKFYAVAKIEGLKVGKSKDEWIEKLNDCGIRAVNNIADITNLAMLEFGQPLHAFDGKKVKGRIIVRGAKDNEKIITLDEKQRVLKNTDLVIADEDGAVGIAGVMGGKESEVSNSTDTILLEAAIFNPKLIRKTVQRLNLPSEASKRFIHGLTKHRLIQALDKAIELCIKEGGKLTGLSVIGEIDDEILDIKLSLEKINQLVGVEFKRDLIKEYLERLNCQFIGERKEGNDTVWIIRRPYYRLDLEIEEDLIEEVARMYGYEKIPAKKLEGERPEEIDQSFFELTAKLKNVLVSEGLVEIQTYSFYSTNILNALGVNGEGRELVEIANPISSETRYLRDNIWPNLAEVAVKNLKMGIEDIAIFEVGKVFNPQKGGGLPIEEWRVAAVILDGSDEEILELFQITIKVAREVGLEAEIVERELGKEDQKLFHKKRSFTLKINGKECGVLLELHPRVGYELGTEKRIAVVEFKVPR